MVPCRAAGFIGGSLCSAELNLLPGDGSSVVGESARLWLRIQVLV